MPDAPNVSENTIDEPRPGSHIERGTGQGLFQTPGAVFLLFGIAFLLCATYMFSYLKTGWLPEDDGLLSQYAFRVFHSELPHRDFAENYTGGLSCLNALAFRIFGVNLFALRAMMFVFFLAWLPAFFYLASRFLSAIPAAALMIAATVWGVPNYPTPMPSWYNLFFAVFGAAALMRYIESEHRRWLLLAGFCGGLSILVKIVGLYYVAAVLIFLVFREQILNGSAILQRPRPGILYRIVSIAGLLAFLAMIFLLMRHRFDDREFVQFFLPSGSLVGLLIWRELRQQTAVSDGRRFAALFKMVAPFILGLVAPIVLFLAPYAMSGSLHTLVGGAVGQGAAKAQSLSLVRPGHALFLFFVLPLVGLIVVGAFWKQKAGPLLTIPLAVTGALLLYASFGSADITQGIWLSAALSTPVFVSLGVLLILIGPPVADDVSPLRQQQVILALALVAVCSLVQFPFAVKIYFCYFAPLLFLAVAAVTKTAKRYGNPGVLICVLAFYTLFAVLRMVPGAIYDNQGFKTRTVWGSLNLPHGGGLKVEYPQIYEAAIRNVLEHAGTGAVIATPDCPEVYFLSGLKNPTQNDGALSPEEILKAIESRDINVVVINDSSMFSQSTLTSEVIRALSMNFPHRTQTGKYWVCWR